MTNEEGKKKKKKKQLPSAHCGKAPQDLSEFKHIVIPRQAQALTGCRKVEENHLGTFSKGYIHIYLHYAVSKSSIFHM